MISKRFFSIFTFLAVFLAACGSSTQTSTPVQPGAAQPQATRQPGCTVVSRQPTAGPTEQSQLPPPTERDWIKGSADAYLTITEYSDFQ